MPTSKSLSGISTIALFACMAFLGMMVLSSGYYLFTDNWVITTGAVWFMFAVVAAIAAFICNGLSSTAKKMEQEEERKLFEREANARQRQSEIDSHLAEQKFIARTAAQLCKDALNSLHRLPSHLDEAGRCLAVADKDWQERVFNPFWNAIEGCAVKLAEFERDIESIEKSADEFEKLIPRFEGELPPFPISAVSVEAMNSFEAIYGAMDRKTRRALGDIEFAQIFEGWRGNKIMLAGFADLQSAVREMSTTIAREISSLGSRIESMDRNFGSLANSINDQKRSMDSYATASLAQNADLLRAAKESSYQEKEIAKQLRSIETRYKYSR